MTIVLTVVKTFKKFQYLFLFRVTYLELSLRHLVILKYQKTVTKNIKHAHTHTKHDLITWCKMLQNKIDFVLDVRG